MSKKGLTKYTKEKLEEHLESSTSLTDITRKIIGSSKVHGSMIALIKKRLLDNELDFSHFNGIKAPKGGSPNTKEDIEMYYLSSSPVKTTNNTNLKGWLFKFGILKNICNCCGIGPIWNGHPISLQLDHIDGINTNNDLINLQILCPNCHSQTETYAGKKNKK